MTTNRRPDRAFRPQPRYGRVDLVPQTWAWDVSQNHVHSRIPGGGERCHRGDARWCFAGFGPVRVVGPEEAAVLAPPRAPGLPGPTPAEAAAALASLQNMDWSATVPVILPAIPEDLAPPMPDEMREEWERLFTDAALVEPQSYNFIVIRRDADDLAATLDDRGQALVDDPAAGGVRTFATIQDLVEAYGGDRRVKLVWERDQWPPPSSRSSEFTADMVRQAVAAGRARHLATPPAERPVRSPFPCPGDLPAPGTP